MSDLHKKLARNNIPLLPSKKSMPNDKHGKIGRDYSELAWQQFFDDNIQILISDKICFNAYTKGSSGPLLYLLHGGGYSGRTWACFAEEIGNLIDCQILAPDLRGHGDTVTNNDLDLSAETLANDCKDIIDMLFKDSTDLPPIFLIGHSMGGAVAVHAASKGYLSSLIGLCVIDVVEGSAVQALQSMQTFLRSRPTSFPSVEFAVEWCIKSGQTHNLKAARVSMPAQIKKFDRNYLMKNASKDAVVEDKASGLYLPDELVEEVDKDNGVSHSSAQQDSSAKDFKVPNQLSNYCYVWRIDLTKTEPFWHDWFHGLSKMFLSITVPKLLLLAGVDRLDKDLTVGQMQGKFQMIVLPKVGHAIHEDSPLKVAEVLATFLVRNRFTSAKKTFDPVFPGC